MNLYYKRKYTFSSRFSSSLFHSKQYFSLWEMFSALLWDMGPQLLIVSISRRDPALDIMLMQPSADAGNTDHHQHQRRVPSADARNTDLQPAPSSQCWRWEHWPPPTPSSQCWRQQHWPPTTLGSQCWCSQHWWPATPGSRKSNTSTKLENLDVNFYATCIIQYWFVWTLAILESFQIIFNLFNSSMIHTAHYVIILLV